VGVHYIPIKCGTKSKSWQINYLIARINLITAHGNLTIQNLKIRFIQVTVFAIADAQIRAFSGDLQPGVAT
jgi:hypothetical protein